MIPFGIALAESAPGIKAFAEVLGSMGPIIIATFEGIGNVIDKISGGIAMIITTIATSIKSLADLDPLRLLGVAGGIGAVGLAIAGFGAGAGAGGVMSAIGSFFDEDPVEKFNRFATIDSGKLVEVAGAIDKLGIAIANFGNQVGKIGEVSGIIDTIDKVMELHDAVSENPISEAVEGVASAVGDIFAKAASFVTSSAPEASSVTTSTAAPAAGAAAAAPQGSLKEVADLLKQILSATSQPVSINIGGKVIDEIGKQTTLRKTYSTKIDTAHGAFG
jgi:type IV secretory pathway protease TraF